MPQKYRVRYTPAAVDDIDEAFSYISEENINAAESLLDMIDEKIGMLGEFPYPGAVLSEDDYTLVQGRFRLIVAHPYLVFYKVESKGVIIHRVLHSRRDYLRELFSPTVE